MIYARDIRKQFAGKSVLKNISFNIGDGEIFGLLGPSGAGKTTLIKILTGQLKADGGEAAMSGKDVQKLSGADYREIGIMMEQFGVYERLSCLDNLRIFAEMYGIAESTIKRTLNRVGLGTEYKTSAHKLSKGMKNRLQLARVFMLNPKVIFFDEPTSGLDPVSTETIHQLILEKRCEGCTIFLTTHDMSEAAKLCDNVALLNEGNIVEYGNPKEMCRRYNHQNSIRMHFYNGTEEEVQNSRESAERIYELFREGQIETIHSTEPNLETVFLELTGRKLTEQGDRP